MSTVITIDLKRLPAALRSNEAAVRLAIATGARAGAEHGRAIMAKRTPTDLGQLKAGWKVKPGVPTVPESGVVQLTTLRNDAPHAGVVELGARPHTVNPQGWAAIYEWVRRHPELYTAAGRKNNSAWQGPNKPKMRRSKASAGPQRPFHGPDPEISAITNAIVGKLKREGQKPTYFIRKSLGDLGDAMLKEINRALSRAYRSR